MKKVLSFVLILALVLGSFSFAFGLTDVEGNANSEAITVASDLGIVKGFPDGSFMPEKAVNRAEFAAMITRALGVPDSALAGFSATSFKDTSGYGWAVPYLAFCESKGILLGDGMGNVMPGRTINVNEAMTMVLRAVGYTENSALLVGTWPSKYVTLAQDLGLYDDVASMMTVDRANAAQVIYNALTVQKVQVDADGQTTGLKDKDGNPVNMLTAGLNCKAYAPGATTPGAAFIVIGDEASVINLQKYVGAYVTAYENSDNDIVAIDNLKSTFLTGSFDSSPVTPGSVFTTTDDTEYTVTSYTNTAEYNPGVKVFENGVPGSATFTTDEAVTIAVKLSGKKLAEVYSVNEWIADSAFQWEDDMLDTEDAELNGIKFVQTDNDTIDFAKFQLLGASSLENIKVDNIVCVYQAGVDVGDYKAGEITRVTVGTEVVKGDVTKVSGSEYTIDGKVYEISTQGTLEKDVNLGDSGTAYLDYDGNIAYWDKDDASSENYAVLIATDSATKFGVETFQVKLFTKDGVEITVDVKDNATTQDAINIAASPTSSIGSIVEYSLNKDGKVDKITNAGLSMDLDGKVNSDASLIGTKRVATGIVVFLYDADEKEYSIGNIADFDKDVTITTAATTMSAVKNKAGDRVASILISDDIIAGGDNVYGVINSTSGAVYEGDNYLALKGFKGPNAAAFDLVTDQEPDSGTWTKTTSGGILQVITVNASGIITKVADAVDGTGGNVDAMKTFDPGVTVTAVDGNFITVNNGSYKLAADAVIYLWSTSDSKWVVKTSKSILKGKEVKLYESDGGDTDYVYDYVLAVE